MGGFLIFGNFVSEPRRKKTLRDEFHFHFIIRTYFSIVAQFLKSGTQVDLSVKSMDSYSYPMVECIPVSPRTDLFLKTNTQLSLGTSYWVGLGKDKVELNKTMLASQPDQIKKKSNSANTVQMSNLEKIFHSVKWLVEVWTNVEFSFLLVLLSPDKQFIRLEICRIQQLFTSPNSCNSHMAKLNSLAYKAD